MNIISFDLFSLNENNLGVGSAATMDTQPVGTGIEPRDPNLSLNGWDKHKNNINDELNILTDILTSAFKGSNMGVSYINDIFESIRDLSIVRIFRNNQNSLDIYMKFIYEDETYYASFKNWASNNMVETFHSRLFTDNPRLTIRFENIIKIQGVFKKALNWWFMSSEGIYKTLQSVKVYNDMGEHIYIPIGSSVEVIETVTEDEKPFIHLIYESVSYYLCEHDYYFFNWWFKPNEQTKFYL